MPVLDGGPSAAGVESTILAVDGDDVVQLRAGALARDEIERGARPGGRGGRGGGGDRLAGHAREPLRAERESAAQRLAPEPGEAYLAFGARAGTLNLSPAGDLHEAARNLFSMLHELDGRASRIAVAPIPRHGLGEAINDRLNGPRRRGAEGSACRCKPFAVRVARPAPPPSAVPPPPLRRGGSRLPTPTNLAVGGLLRWLSQAAASP